MLEIAKDKGKDLIFVTNDQKNDWFYKQDKIGLYPKYELFDEFRRFTNGKSIAIVNFVKFLELSKAKEDTIAEVKTTIKENYSAEFKTNVDGIIEGLETEHPRFGKGQIMKLFKNGAFDKADISFTEHGTRSFILKFTPLKILDTKLNFILQNPDFDGDPKTYQLRDIDE